MKLILNKGTMNTTQQEIHDIIKRKPCCRRETARRRCNFTRWSRYFNIPDRQTDRQTNRWLAIPRCA